MPFVPHLRGLDNPCMKVSAVRQVCTTETRIADSIFNHPSPPTAALKLWESIIELRDLEFFILTARCYDGNVEKALDFLGEGLAYYLNRMHETDAKVLASKSPQILVKGMTLEQFNLASYRLATCIDGMCKVNGAVICMALKDSSAPIS